MDQKKPRLNWRLADKTFLESCIHEVSLNGRDGGSLKATSWRKVAEKLKTEHDFIVDQKQMKNRYDYLKRKFTAWNKLRNKTGNVYDPIKNTFNILEEEWQIEIRSNKIVETLRRAPLEHSDLCIQLFEGSTSTGIDSWGPSSTLPRTFVEVFDQTGIEDFDDTQMHLVVSQETLDRSKDKRTSPNQGGSEESSVKRKASTQGVGEDSTSRPKKGKGNETFKSKVLEVGDDIRRMANMMIEKHNDMKQCMEKLKTLGWERSDAKYKTVLLLFGESSDIRKVFLQLEPESCDMWVEIAGAKYGLFGA